MMVELKHRRPMLFTADACYSKKNLDTMVISSFHLDRSRASNDAASEGLAEKHDASCSSRIIRRASRLPEGAHSIPDAAAPAVSAGRIG